MSRRAPTPLRSTPSLAPLEAMVAKKQAHIEELVTQTRTLEHTINKLRQALTDEQNRGKEAVAALQQRWQAERLEWREGCESLQVVHRIAHLRTAAELDRERMALLKEREETRRERLARLQRDYRLVAFQSREVELGERVAELELELEETRRSNEEERMALSSQLEGKAGVLEARCEDLAGKLRDTAENLAEALKEKSQAEVRPRLIIYFGCMHMQISYCTSCAYSSHCRTSSRACAKSILRLPPPPAAPQQLSNARLCILRVSNPPMRSWRRSTLKPSVPWLIFDDSSRSGGASKVVKARRWTLFAAAESSLKYALRSSKRAHKKRRRACKNVRPRWRRSRRS